MLREQSVTAYCPTCEALSQFFMGNAQREFGSLIRDAPDRLPFRDSVGNVVPRRNDREISILVRCGGCLRAGLVVVEAGNSVAEGEVVAFFPTAIVKATVPSSCPQELVNELREAEVCAAAGAYRAASAMLRSTLEKTLRKNGYTSPGAGRNLRDYIDAAAADGVIVETHRRRAHENRNLGNDVVHDEWRAVNEDEYDAAHRYVLWILTDFYDDRSTVESLLKSKARL